MDINQLTKIVKKKITEKINVQEIKIEDKSFLHIKHASNEKNKFHLKLTIKSNQLNNSSKLESTKIIYKLLEKEMKENIHSLQILIN